MNFPILVESVLNQYSEEKKLISVHTGAVEGGVLSIEERVY